MVYSSTRHGGYAARDLRPITIPSETIESKTSKLKPKTYWIREIAQNKISEIYLTARMKKREQKITGKTIPGK